MQAKFCKQRLTQARNAKLLSMSDLAKKTGVSRQAISQYEKGECYPTPENLRKISTDLEVSQSYFKRPLTIFEKNHSGVITFRSLSSTKNKARLQARTYLEWLAMIYGVATEFVHLPEVKLPDFDIEDFTKLTLWNIEDIAIDLRTKLEIGLGPISDLTLLLENHGVIVGKSPLDEKLDGLCAWYDGRPFVMISSRKLAVRRRYDLAHELGHLILHKNISDQEEIADKTIHKLVEAQAHNFAGAFLMPERTFAPEVYGTDLDSLVELKARWKVSIQSIIMRMSILDIISKERKIRLFQMMSMKNIRRHEPLDNEIEVEKIRILPKILELLSEGNILSGKDFYEFVGLKQIPLFSDLTGLPDEKFSMQPLSDNVVVLKRD